MSITKHLPVLKPVGALVALAAMHTCGYATTSGAHRSKVDGIIVHAISGPSCVGGKIKFSGAPGDAERWKRFFDGHPFLGIHYLVDRQGRVAASTPEDRQANHALDNNAGTIGIELVHDGDGREPFSEPQIAALTGLLKGIQQRHAIPAERIKGHGDVDKRTFTCGGQVHKGRSDPGPNFPWVQVLTALGSTPAGVAAAPRQRLTPRGPTAPTALAVPVPTLVPMPVQPQPYGLGGPQRQPAAGAGR